MSSLLSNKREVDKLNNLLKQTEDLVQDLQEELELKDSLTVKELVHDDYESQDTHEDTYSKEALLVFSSEHNFDESTKKDQKEDHDQKTQEESMRKIEAELEAELARLEINMNSSTLDGQFSNLVEVSMPFYLYIFHNYCCILSNGIYKYCGWINLIRTEISYVHYNLKSFRIPLCNTRSKRF